MALTGTAQEQGDFDVSVDGLLMNLHITKDQPYRRETAEWRKQQIDVAPEAGEQSITDFWVRSQMSFHLGAGLDYLDTLNDASAATSRFRYADSYNMDVWTPGQIKQLPSCPSIASTTGKTWVTAAQSGTNEVLIFAAGSTITVRRYTSTTSDTFADTTLVAAGPIADLYCDGGDFFYWAAGNALYKSPVFPPAATKIYDLTGTTFAIGYVKQRLMVGVDNKLYEAAGATPALLYTHPSAAWTWTDWAEAPSGIVVTGKGGLRSELFLISLNDASGAPALQPPVSLAVLPRGETVQCLYTYLGSILAIGTSQGLRIGLFDSIYGTFSYGPLNLHDSARNGAVTALTGRGSFVYAGLIRDNHSALIRVDLGTEVEKGLYAWAPDVVPLSGTPTAINSVTVDSRNRLVVAVQTGLGLGNGVYREKPTSFATNSWLTTARIRMGTVADKTFKSGIVRTSRASQQAYTVSAAIDDGFGDVALQSTTGLPDTSRFAVPDTLLDLNSNPVHGVGEYIQLTFAFDANTNGGAATINSYQVMALPAQPHSRLFSLPVAVFDYERTRNGKEIGYPGRAKELLDALEAAETTGRELLVSCKPLGLDPVLCTVERLEFSQLSPPTGGKSYGLGGYANLVFRTSA